MKIPPKLKFAPLYLLSLLPMRALYILSDIGCFILFRILKYRCKVVNKNLLNSFPEKDSKEIKSIEKMFYKHFCDIMIETLKALTISEKEVKKRYIIENPELPKKYFDLNKSITLYSAHQGNWEWLGFLPLFVSHQMTSFYQPLSNSYFDQLMKHIRSRFGVICIESSKGYRTLNKLKDEKVLTMNIIIGDQSPMSNSTKHWLNFLNQDTAFLIGADRIARKSEHVVFFPSNKKIKRGHYQLTFELIEDKDIPEDSTAIIDKYAELLEETIHSSPPMWLWSHRRWKRKREEIN